MIINKRGLKCIVYANRDKCYLFSAIFKNFSTTHLRIDNDFFQNKFHINPKTEKIKIELILNNLLERKFQIHLTEAQTTPRLSNEKEPESLNNNSIEKHFNFKFLKEENRLILSSKNKQDFGLKDKENDIEVYLPVNTNLFLNIKESKNVTITSDQVINGKKIFESKENLNNFELSCEESKINVSNDLVYSNISINANKSEIKFQGLLAYKRKPLHNFKLFEESFLKSNKSNPIQDENYNSESAQLKSESEVNQSKDINIIANNSKIEIDEIKNFNKLFLRTNQNLVDSESAEEPSNSSIDIDYSEIRNFDIELKNPKDKLKMNIHHLLENSIFRMKNIDFKNVNLKFHPLLLFYVNAYNTNKGKFQKLLIFDNEGYSFCPTIIFEIDKEFPKNYLVGFELIKISKYLKVFLYVLISMFFTKIIFLSDNSLENCMDLEANLNTLDNLPRQISEYKFYQLAMKKKFDKLLENIDK